jgi:surface antigen
MMTKTILLAAAAVLALGTAAQAGPDEPYGSNPNHYYSANDRDGYYDRNGTYHHFDRDSGYDRSSYQSGGYYYNEADDVECRDNRTGATVAGALAGGLIGGAASHGNGGAIVGGAVLGGLVGNSLGGVDCYDRRYAYDSYYRGLNGDIGVRVDWRNDRYGDYGYFVPVREYTNGGYRCRDWRSVTYRKGREVVKTGRACRRTDGQWYFD